MKYYIHREIHLFSLTKAYIFFYVVLFYWYIYIYVCIVNILIWKWELSLECHFSVASPVILFRHIFLPWWLASISHQSPDFCLSLVLGWHAQVTTYCSCGWGGHIQSLILSMLYWFYWLSRFHNNQPYL